MRSLRRILASGVALGVAAALIWPTGAAAGSPLGTPITGMSITADMFGIDRATAPNAIDGDPVTYVDIGGYGYLTIDLGAEYHLGGVELLTRGCEGPSIYDVAGADVLGRPLEIGSGPLPEPDAIIDLPADPGAPLMHYVRVTIENTTSFGCTHRLYEVRVFSAPALHFAFSGFFAPVDNATTNVVNAGAAVPVKFGLGGDQGLDIVAAGYPSAVPIGCATGIPLGAGDESVAATFGPLTYDATAGRYQFIWKTQKSYAGECLQLQLKLTDGSRHTADFGFR